ncbi:MAG: hypothetical protein IKT67_09275 [Lachnospiraceae bacterium]|nr:hypothetical protein [Lachnospiraceae bacterium]
MQRSKQPNEKALYLIKTSPYGGAQVVLHVTDKFKEGYLCFDDTDRGHMIQGEIKEYGETAFPFVDIKKNLWEFEEVMIDMFRERVYRFVANGEEIAESCNTTDEFVDD